MNYSSSIFYQISLVLRRDFMAVVGGSVVENKSQPIWVALRKLLKMLLLDNSALLIEGDLGSPFDETSVSIKHGPACSSLSIAHPNLCSSVDPGNGHYRLLSFINFESSRF